MNSMCLLKTYNLITECNKAIHEYEESMVDTVNGISKNAVDNIPLISTNFIPSEYIDSQLDVLDAISDRVPELEKFFTEIYSNTDFQKSILSTTPVFDINEIKGFRPQYLTQFTKNVAKNIQRIIDGSIDSSELTNMTDVNGTIKSLKKNLVSSNMPDYLKDKNFINFDNKIVVQVNSYYIQTTLLPFLRSSSIEVGEFHKVVSDITETINDGIKTMNDFTLTLKDLIANGKVKSKVAVPYIMGANFVFMSAAKYMLGCMMRKIYIYTSNIKEYGTLKDQLMKSFNNGSDVLHESVLDGSYEFRDEDVVIDMLNGRCDLTDSIIDRVYNKFKDYLLELKGTKVGDSFHSLIDLEITNSGFDLQLYRSMLSMEASLAESVEKLVTVSRDPLLSIEEIQSECKLSDKLYDMYSDVFVKIKDIDIYINNEQKYDSCTAILNELQYGKKFMCKFASNMQGIYAVLCDLKKDISINDNDEFENHERNREELLFLDTLDKDLRQFILDLSRAYISRLRDLEDTLINNDSELSDFTPNAEDLEQTDDYLCRALEENLDIDNGYMEAVIANLYNEYAEETFIESVAAPKISIFMEADDNANNNNQNNNNSNQNNQSGGNNNNDKNSTKPQVQDNSGEGDSNQNNNTNNNQSGDQNNSGGKGPGVKGIVDKIKEFISGLGKKMTELVQNSVKKGHKKFLEENKEALLSRSYNNVQVNILPYSDIKYVDVLNDCSTQLANFKGNPSRMKEKDVDSMMFKKIPLGKVDKSLKINERINIALKSDRGKVETVPFANSTLAQEVTKMINYCEYYYNNFDKDFESAVNKLTSTLDSITSNASSINDAKDPDGTAASKTFQHMGTNINLIMGCVGNVSRDREKDYYQVLSQLVPKNKKKKDNDDDQNNNDQNNSDQNNNQDDSQK